MTAMHADLSLCKAVLKQYLETEMIDGRRMRHGPLRLFVTIAGAKLNLICLPQKLVADLASAPKICFQNFSSRRGWAMRGGEGKNDEPLFTRTFGDGCIFNSLQAVEGCWMKGGWVGFQGLPMILGLSEDMSAPRGSIADDKVTRLRVNLCYLHLITVSCVLVPPDGPLSIPILPTLLRRKLPVLSRRPFLAF